MNSVCIIAKGYPTKDNPEYAFIRPVAHGFSDNGIMCTVIVPQSITKVFLGKKKRRKRRWIDITKSGNKVYVYQPTYLSLSLIKFRGNAISNLLSVRAIKRAIKKYKINTDVFYGHFWESGINACLVADKKPVYVACGESDIWVYERYTQKVINDALPQIKGVICVSTKNKIECEELGLLKFNPKTIVLPNAVDENEFYYLDKSIARDKIGLKTDDLVAIFVGAFIERKGVLRVIEAAKDIKGLKLILIGKGNQVPVSEQIFFKGVVPHEEIVYYLNASDMFVLPTLSEGCCNAIVEAMSCGLPIVSSDLSFNDDILDSSNSIRVSPNSIDSIAEAITDLANNAELRKHLSEGALLKAEEQTIKKRISRIIQFLS